MTFLKSLLYVNAKGAFPEIGNDSIWSEVESLSLTNVWSGARTHAYAQVLRDTQLIFHDYLFPTHGCT